MQHFGTPPNTPATHTNTHRHTRVYTMHTLQFFVAKLAVVIFSLPTRGVACACNFVAPLTICSLPACLPATQICSRPKVNQRLRCDTCPYPPPLPLLTPSMLVTGVIIAIFDQLHMLLGFKIDCVRCGGGASIIIIPPRLQKAVIVIVCMP